MKISPTFRQTLILFLGLGLSVPTGVLIAALLSRKLGSETYGVINVTISIIYWLEVSSLQLFGRTTVRFISAAEDWQAIGSTLLRVQLLVGLAACGLAVISAQFLASVFNAPLLAATIPVLALDIPLNGLAQTQGSILIGRGRAWERSMLFAIRWIARVALIVLFLAFGFGIFAPLLGYVGASLVEVLTASWFLRLSLTLWTMVNFRQILIFALPIGVYTICLELFNNLDLFMVRSLLPGPNAGYYSAAQYLTVVSDLIAASLSPVLISMITRQLIQGQQANAARLVKDAFRLVFALAPFVALAAGSASSLLLLIYEPDFRVAGPSMAILLFGGLGSMLIVTGTAVLVAYDLPGWTGILVALLIPLAILGHLVVIHSIGMSGAAWVTALLAWVCGLIVMIAASHRAKTTIPLRSIVLAAIFSLVCYGISANWNVDGWLVIVKLAVLSVLPLTGYLLLGEYSIEHLIPGIAHNSTARYKNEKYR